VFKLLIVEDESKTRAALRQFIPWNAWGIGAVLEAGNGKQALHIAERERPDFILTDIRMPVMDGVELARRVSETMPDTGIIMLSAYSDLQYFKSAMKSRAIDYLLKPVDTAELEQAIRSAAERLRQREERKKERQVIDRNLPLLRSNFFLSLLKEAPNDESDALATLRSLGMELPAGTSWHVVELGFAPDEGTRPAAAAKEAAALLEETYREVAWRQVAIDRDRCFVFLGRPPGDAADDRTLSALAEEAKAQLEEAHAGKAVLRMTERPLGLCELFRTAGLLEPVGPVDWSETDKASIDRQTALVQTVKEIVASRYAEETLSVNAIAEQVSYTAAYVCMVFKRATGTTVNHYMNQYRIRMAKKLLADPDIKMYEIAQRVGYANENYFSKVFKKYEHVSPSEYKRGRD